MSRSASRSIRARRGYLLLEVMLGGVMAASVLGFMMVAMVDAKNRRVVASRDATAGSIAAQLMEKARSLQYDGLGDELTVNRLTDGQGSPFTMRLKGSYDVTVAITAGTETSLIGETLDYKSVQLTVSYLAPGGLIRDLSASTRIYRD